MQAPKNSPINTTNNSPTQPQFQHPDSQSTLHTTRCNYASTSYSAFSEPTHTTALQHTMRLNHIAHTTRQAVSLCTHQAQPKPGHNRFGAARPQQRTSKTPGVLGATHFLLCCTAAYTQFYSQHNVCVKQSNTQFIAANFHRLRIPADANCMYNSLIQSYGLHDVDQQQLRVRLHSFAHTHTQRLGVLGRFANRPER